MIWYQIFYRLWKLFSSFAVELLARNHGFLLDTLCPDWWPLGEPYVMLLNSDLFPMWHPLSYWYYSDSSSVLK